MAIGMHHNYYKELESHVLLKRVKEVVLAYGKLDNARADYMYMNQMRMLYPSATIRAEEADFHTQYCNDFMKRHGAHDAMKFRG